MEYSHILYLYRKQFKNTLKKTVMIAKTFKTTNLIYVLGIFLVISACGNGGMRKDYADEGINYQEMATEDISYEMEEATDMPSPDIDDDGVKKDSFNTEEYDRIYENPFVSAIKNPLSTFSVDVDRASYANVGFISQNIYLFCAANSLGTVVRGSFDNEKLRKAMRLEDGEVIILCQTVGHYSE